MVGTNFISLSIQAEFSPHQNPIGLHPKQITKQPTNAGQISNLTSLTTQNSETAMLTLHPSKFSNANRQDPQPSRCCLILWQLRVDQRFPVCVPRTNYVITRGANIVALE
jgi:hypothetical protein